MLLEYLFYGEAIRAYLLYYINSIFGSVGKVNESNIYQRLLSERKGDFKGKRFPLIIMTRAFHKVLEVSLREKVDMWTAALMVAVKAEATRLRGLYP